MCPEKNSTSIRRPRHTGDEDIRKGDDASRKFQKEKLRPTTQSRNPKT